VSPQHKKTLNKAALAALPFIAASIVWAAKAFAGQQVQPVADRVTVLEVQRSEDSDRLKRVEAKTDRILILLAGQPAERSE
jgi:hypothetical protein